MPKESEFTNGVNPLCPDDSLWTSRDVQSSEDEVSEFLGALVRMIKPRVVVETGCYLGDATIAMAKALKGCGRRLAKVVACDTDESRAKIVMDRVIEEKLFDNAVVSTLTGLELIEKIGDTADFFFIDSSPEGAVRKAEIEMALDLARPGTLIAVHDTAPQHVSVRNAVESVEGAQKIYFNTPRGLTLLMKPYQN